MLEDGASLYHLAEVHFMLKGHRHGFEWWLNEDRRSVYQERRWSLDEAPGIEREWNEKGKLRTGSRSSTSVGDA